MSNVFSYTDIIIIIFALCLYALITSSVNVKRKALKETGRGKAVNSLTYLFLR